MAVDEKTVKRIAHLARIAVTQEEITHLKGELNAILDFVAELDEVNVEGVEPMTSVTPMVMKKRADIVNDGGITAKILANAPEGQETFFTVPKVVE
jgi:aspartyl-tRNA(Asn)/glutamyl-tRNA(Gln) amidotransferase subunit C